MSEEEDNQEQSEAFSFRQTVTLTPSAGSKMNNIIDKRKVAATVVYREAIDLFLNRPPERFLPVDTVAELVRKIVREELNAILKDKEITPNRQSHMADEGSEPDKGQREEQLTQSGTSQQRQDEYLNAIAIKIARAVVHETFIEFWNRYRGGERNVFTQQLYTPKGQRTFDEIRTRYQNDAKFRTAVDRYCSDFEKLLEDAEQEGGDALSVQFYLTSDTGKVYTMLAHASGRLQ